MVATLIFIFFGSPLLGQNMTALAALLICVFGIWKTISNAPWYWNNKIILDFENRQISLVSLSRSSNDNLLDFKGEVFPVGEIDGYATQQFESFITSPVYLIKLKVRGRSVKLLAFKDASKFTDFIKILTKDFNLEIKESGSNLSLK